MPVQGISQCGEIVLLCCFFRKCYMSGFFPLSEPYACDDKSNIIIEALHFRLQVLFLPTGEAAKPSCYISFIKVHYIKLVIKVENSVLSSSSGFYW